MGDVILVTGASGFIGRRLVAKLGAGTDAGRPAVVATGRNPAPPDLPAGCDYLQADLSEPAGIKALVERGPYRTVVHLAALATFQDSLESNQAMYRANVAATFHLLEMLGRQAGRVVFASTGMIYGDQPGPFREDMVERPENVYALTKVMGEEMVRSYARRLGLGHLIFRTAIIYGPGQPEKMFIPSLAAALAEGREFPMTEGRQVRDFLYIDDCVEAFRLATLGGLEGTYNLAGGVRSTLREVAEMAAGIAGALEKLKPGALAYRSNELWEYYMDIGALKAALAWRPEVGLKDGLERVVKHAFSLRR